jgi:hypothetical protein
MLITASGRGGLTPAGGLFIAGCRPWSPQAVDFPAASSPARYHGPGWPEGGYRRVRPRLVVYDGIVSCRDAVSRRTAAPEHDRRPAGSCQGAADGAAFGAASYSQCHLWSAGGNAVPDRCDHPGRVPDNRGRPGGRGCAAKPCRSGGEGSADRRAGRGHSRFTAGFVLPAAYTPGAQASPGKPATAACAPGGQPGGVRAPGTGTGASGVRSTFPVPGLRGLGAAGRRPDRMAMRRPAALLAPLPQRPAEGLSRQVKDFRKELPENPAEISNYRVGS